MQTARLSAEGRFIALAAATVLCLCLAVAVANAIVDPFGINRIVVIRGFNAFKPTMQNRVRLAKAFDVRRIKPRAIVLGTSRSHVAIRTTHPGWDPPMKSTHIYATLMPWRRFGRWSWVLIRGS